MNFKKIALPLVLLALLLSTAPQTTLAQTSFGASYEIRQEEPKHGFGLRIEQDIFSNFPIVNLGLRAHFSYFNDDNNVTVQDGNTQINFSRDVTNYDYGLALVGGATVGPIGPYAGLGLGASTLNVDRNDLPDNTAFDPEDDDTAIYWNGFVGAKVSIIPALKPFVEYRFEDVSNYKDELSDIQNSNGRLIFGVSLSF